MRAGLNRSVIAERGLAIVDEHGLAALTMRRLASELGVEAASLYNHVASKADLLDAVVDCARSEMRLPGNSQDGPPGDLRGDGGEIPTEDARRDASPGVWPEDWREGLALIFTEYCRTLLAHPNLIPLAGRRTAPGPTGIDHIAAQGIPRPAAERMWQAALALTLGFASFASGALPASGATPEEGAWSLETYRHALGVLIAGMTGGEG